MVRHVLLLQPRQGTTPHDAEVCREALTSLVGRIPGLVSCHWGQNFAPAERTEGLTHGFTMDFVDRDSLDAYGPHPDHRVAATKVRAAFERIVVLDIDL
jgi:hypothetical protein